MEAQLAAIASVIGAIPSGPASAGADASPADTAEIATLEPAAPPATEVAAGPDVTEAPVAATTSWRDTIDHTLQPGEGIEIKLVMQEAEVATFEWTANGGVLNDKTHAEGSGQEISYETGRATLEQSGTLTAAFIANHGWFWRNRSDAPVTLALRTAGDYAQIKSVREPSSVGRECRLRAKPPGPWLTGHVPWAGRRRQRRHSFVHGHPPTAVLPHRRLLGRQRCTGYPQPDRMRDTTCARTGA